MVLEGIACPGIVSGVSITPRRVVALAGECVAVLYLLWVVLATLLLRKFVRMASGKSRRLAHPQWTSWSAQSIAQSLLSVVLLLPS